MPLVTPAVYRAGTRMLEPFAGVALRVAARGEGSALRAERRAHGDPEPVDTWWHAASLGEVAALAPVLSRAVETGLAHRFCVTTTTATGREAARRLWGERAGLAPLDLPGTAARFLAARRPRALVLVETELWPNWLLSARERDVAVGILNARISDRSWPRYRRLRGLFAPLLADARAVAAREAVDAERFLALGAPPGAVRVTGNTKHDGAAPRAPAGLPWSGEPVWVVGSLRPGEEEALLDAFVCVRERVPLRLVVAPRHPEEWRDPLSLLARRGLAGALRSRPRAEDVAAPVLWVDQVGELAALYAAATVAFVGGTLVPVGGHNVMEAAAGGAPVLFGPHLANVEADAGALVAQGGGRRVDGKDDLVTALLAWLEDPRARERAAGAARRTAGERAGGASRALAWLVERGVLAREPA